MHFMKKSVYLGIFDNVVLPLYNKRQYYSTINARSGAERFHST